LKSKLLLFITIVAVMLSMFSLSALASSRFVNITRPEGNEVVYKEIYSIGCIGTYDDTTIEFSYKDRVTGKYKPLLSTEGESSFRVDKGNFFGKDVELKYKGENEIRVTSYTKSTKNDPQESDYTITLAEETKKSNWFDDALKWFKGLSLDDKK